MGHRSARVEVDLHQEHLDEALDLALSPQRGDPFPYTTPGQYENLWLRHETLKTARFLAPDLIRNAAETLDFPRTIKMKNSEKFNRMCVFLFSL